MDTRKKQFRILIVEDDPLNIQVLKKILSGPRYMLMIAGSGEEGISIAKEMVPDLILMDIMMPGIDGYTACKHIKEIDTLKAVPLIFITAKTNQEDIIKGFKAGAVDYVSKPFNEYELYARVSAHLKIKEYADNQAELISELQNAVSQVKTLSGLLPICSQCKKIRNDSGNWQQMEEYISQQSDAEFTHGLCPTCMKELYPGYSH